MKKGGEFFVRSRFFGVFSPLHPFHPLVRFGNDLKSHRHRRNPLLSTITQHSPQMCVSVIRCFYSWFDLSFISSPLHVAYIYTVLLKRKDTKTAKDNLLDCITKPTIASKRESWLQANKANEPHKREWMWHCADRKEIDKRKLAFYKEQQRQLPTFYNALPLITHLII